MPWNNPIFGHLDITNGSSEEDFAECFVSYLLAAEEFYKKHPEAFDSINSILKGNHLKQAIKLLI